MMLPEPATFDGFVASLAGPLARLEFVRHFDEELARLRQRSARARALACLEGRERRVPTPDLCRVLGVRQVRLQQLIFDGRRWREYDAQQEDSNGG